MNGNVGKWAARHGHKHSINCYIISFGDPVSSSCGHRPLSLGGRSAPVWHYATVIYDACVYWCTSSLHSPTSPVSTSTPGGVTDINYYIYYM